MEEAGTSVGRRLLAGAVLVVAAYVLLKLVIGFVTAVAGTVVLVLAVIAIVWALRVIL